MSTNYSLNIILNVLMKSLRLVVDMKLEFRDCVKSLDMINVSHSKNVKH